MATTWRPRRTPGAANLLVPRADWRRFTRLGDYTRAAVLQFAENRRSPRESSSEVCSTKGFSRGATLNDLKARLKWTGK